MINPRSIRFRLVVWYAGLLATVFILLGALMYEGLKVYLEQSLRDAQFRRANQIAETLIANIDRTGEAHVANEINSWFAPDTSGRFIRITREGGGVVYLSANPRDRSFEAGQIPAAAGPFRERFWRKESAPDDRQLLIAAVTSHSAAGRRFLVEVGVSLEPVREVLKRVLLLFGSGLVVMVLAAVSGGYLLVRNALAPVGEIAASAERITMDNLKERLPIARTGDELERLSTSLNHMIARLEDAFEHNQRFVADASHELRTPLTILRGELESIVDEARHLPEIEAAAASVLDEVERLARIVEGLFSIARLEAGEAKKESVCFDLAQLAVSTAEQMCLLAEDKGISVTCDAAEAVPVLGDRARMKQVVVNLLDNAIKYTSEGGSVRLTVLAVKDRAILEVEDNGMGIPADAKPYVFERFFRADKARSREMGGAGLGLSIVKSICVAHGGQIDFQSKEGSGSRFKVELPLARNGDSGGPAKTDAR